MVFPLGGFEFQAHTFGISAGENDAVRVANVIALANNDVSVCVNLSRVHGLSLDVYMLSHVPHFRPCACVNEVGMVAQ